MDFCIKTKMENSEMITSNPIKKNHPINFNVS